MLEMFGKSAVFEVAVAAGARSRNQDALESCGEEDMPRQLHGIPAGNPNSLIFRLTKRAYLFDLYFPIHRGGTFNSGLVRH